MKDWIGDNIILLIGMTSLSLEKQIIRLCSEAESPRSFAALLYKQGMPISSNTRRFAKNFFKIMTTKFGLALTIDNKSMIITSEKYKNKNLKALNYELNFDKGTNMKKKAKIKTDNYSKLIEDQRNNQTYESNKSFEIDSVTRLRYTSRQAYLGKRERQKLEALRLEIEDEENMFINSGVKLTKEELDILKYNREVFALASERKNRQEKISKTELYQIPNDQHSTSVKDNSNTAEDELRPSEDLLILDEHKWEFDQFKKTNLPTKNLLIESSYSILLENQIDFIKDEMIISNKIPSLDIGNTGTDICKKRESLPMFPHKHGIIDALEKYQTLIVEAETGSGKTTQLTQYLLEAGYTQLGKIGCTQPRRVAAMSVAARVAKEMDVQLGREVGYTIRFEDCTSHKTLIKYMTDGMLLREFLSEPDLASYSVIILDEAHERTLHTDILFGLVKDVTKFRADLRLIISSATLDACKFSEFFDDAPIYKVPGGMFPVEIFYTKMPEADYLEAAVNTTMQIHIIEPSGDILIFLTGQEEIETCDELLRQKTKGHDIKIGEMVINTVYANLPTELQSNIFDPTPEGARKIIIATNIAETSLTIDGVKYVIDSGFTKQNKFNAKSCIDSLAIIPISQASARQRAGRAGRTSAGKCYRLYTKWAYENEMDINTIPEIQRTSLTTLLLITKSLGINDIMSFDFMDPPPTENLSLSLEQLYALNALNHKGEITKLGRRMAEFPVDPQIAKMLLISEKYEVSEEIVTIAAMVSSGASVFYRPKDRQFQADSAHKTFQRHYAGDHISLLSVFNDWRKSSYAKQFCIDNYIQLRTVKRVRDMRDQLINLMDRVDLDIKSKETDYNSICKCIIAGFFYNVARLSKKGSYETINNQLSIHIHPSSCLFELNPKYVVYNELIHTTKEYMRIVSEIKPTWLIEMAPHIYAHGGFNIK